MTSEHIRTRRLVKQRAKRLMVYATMLFSFLPATRNNEVGPPEENRFTKVVLAEKLDEPMELAIAPGGSIFFIERKGKIKQYLPQSGKTLLVGELSVFSGSECGLLGLTLDPDFAVNHQIYLFYTPDKSRHRLSRFTLAGSKIDPASEKMYLEVPLDTSGRTAHTGGSLAFDTAGNLYISVGDNTNPSESGGYAPLDERAGRSIYDAQRSAGNTNDLRGKILRIHPLPNGTYTIPEGNLFPKDEKKGRPEIYVMGCRNPYRIAVDAKTAHLYWGEIGPDAGKDSTHRGPRGYDEINRATRAGNFGWPYFIADNKPYISYLFGEQKSESAFDPGRPVNRSARNTGSQLLPPAQPALIWYPYTASPEFPLVGEGGRNAMAGPVYHADRYQNAPHKFPAYYDGKLFIYDWMRGWIMTVAVNQATTKPVIEPFLPNTSFDKPVDMDFGPDGRLYLLEYGTNWFSGNDNARLVRIEYTEGNRKPVARLTADKPIGAAPLKITFSAKESLDYDGDSLRFEWTLNGSTAKSNKATWVHTFDQPGVYRVSLKVTDAKGNTSQAQTEIKAGNEAPKVSLEVLGNQTFYWDHTQVNYKVAVEDKEDGSLENKKINPAAAKVHLDFLAQGKDLALLTPGHQMEAGSLPPSKGKALIDKSDCKSCHALNAKSVGPSYQAIATKYKGNPSALPALATKIIKGGSGNWGDIPMSAHPQHTQSETTEMVQFILSLAEEKKDPQSLPLEGRFKTDQHLSSGTEGTYLLTAAYTDKGANGMASLTDQKVLMLRHAKVEAEELKGLTVFSKNHVGDIRHGAFTVLKDTDLSGISKITYRYASNGAGGRIEIRLDAKTGPVISVAELKNTGAWDNWTEVSAPCQHTTGRHNLYMLFVNEQSAGAPLTNLDWMYFHASP